MYCENSSNCCFKSSTTLSCSSLEIFSTLSVSNIFNKFKRSSSVNPATIGIRSITFEISSLVSVVRSIGSTNLHKLPDLFINPITNLLSEITNPIAFLYCNLKGVKITFGYLVFI